VNSIYHQESGDGVIDVGDGVIHTIRIEVKDPVGNKSWLQCKVQYRPVPAARERQWSGKIFYPMMIDGYESEDCSFYIGEKCLYDSVHLSDAAVRLNQLPPNAVSYQHVIGARYIPLQDSFLVRIRSNGGFTEELKNKVIMERSAGGKKEVRKVEWQNDWASARFRDFGAFQLFVDSEPPVILPVGFQDGADESRATRMVFIVKDNQGGIKNFRAELDGKWLRFTNDKGRAFIYIFDQHCPPGKHELSVSVQDEAGNVAVKKFRFAR
jgi:hypothetical protein